MSKIIYVPMQYDPQRITKAMLRRLAEIACEHVRTVSNMMRLQSLSDRDVSIEFRVITDLSDRDAFFNAKARRIQDHHYEIVVGGGMLVHLDLIAQTLVADDTALRGLRRGCLLNDEARKVGVGNILHDFNFHYLVGGIFWHEFAHIFLGHLDWLKEKRDGSYMCELHMKPLTDEEAEDYQMLEGDADRHAANFLLTSFDHSLSNNPYFRYQSEDDKFFDFGYMVASLFEVFHALENEVPSATRTHPENDVRTMISVHYLSQYLDQYRNTQADALKVACAKGAGAARERTFYANKRPPDEMSIVLKAFEVDFRPQQMGVRKHQLKLSTGPSSITTRVQ